MKKNLGCYILNKEEFEFAKNASLAYAESIAAMIKSGELKGEAKDRGEKVLEKAIKFIDAFRDCKSV